MEKIYKKKYSLHAYEVDFAGKAHLSALLNYLQDAAGEHAGRLGFSITELLKNDQTWLLSRYHVKIFHYPSFGREVTVSTWPSGAQGIFALRDFEMVDERGELVLVATSSWILLDLQKKLPLRVEIVLAGRPLFDRRALEDSFQPLPQIGRVSRERSFRVLTRDLDFNRHVNNVVYIQWALEAVTDEIALAKRPLEVEVSYRAEAFYGDEIISRVDGLEGDPAPTFVHQILNQSTGAELARLRTVWG